MASRGKRLQKKMKGCAVVAFPSFKTQDGRQFYQIHKKQRIQYAVRGTRGLRAVKLHVSVRSTPTPFFRGRVQRLERLKDGVTPIAKGDKAVVKANPPPNLRPFLKKSCEKIWIIRKKFLSLQQKERIKQLNKTDLWKDLRPMGNKHQQRIYRVKMNKDIF